MRITNLEIYNSSNGKKVLLSVTNEDANLTDVEVQEALDTLKKGVPVEASFKAVRKARSTDANALMWHCLTQIAYAIGSTKEEVYLEMLRRYTVGRHVACNLSAVDSIMRTCRECERLEDVEVNGQKLAQLVLYVGSSHFDTSEMSHFLDCIISEMRDMGLPTPTPERTREVVKAYVGEV